ncbi:Putative mutY, A/G-specific adenine glycosylase [Parvularcula bermudensis HTCC2503]|uniref:Adenine DNA glycosylase n=1 Tax=Parvularcula bermudensis (strain ATCC BAA-594 / HTCC2503 / KCTC 12087) TaxID=314260 RepID=E0TC66_PARBH|nr:A/G-specific adenine glycosylase [Parvularcula bermudensis]ADM08499.1 Putative mutY, A/G-specific adenine glycosylase [Parvularcula bermudensis HTCC2503]
MTRSDKTAFSTSLLEWYDRHARQLPWRISPAASRAGVRPDPYRVWLSEIMLQQTTVATVTPRFAAFVQRWDGFPALAEAPLEEVLGEWAGLGYYSRARNLHACAKVVTRLHDGQLPASESALKDLPGIGPYTAAAIAAIAFDRRAVVVDGNVERIMVRQAAIERPIKEAKAAIYALAAEVVPDRRGGDYAQALMDLGATICRPRRPDCLLCPVRSSCRAHALGLEAQLPVKPPKKKRPTRRGIIYVGIGPRGCVLSETRPAKGLFGGMRGLPGSAWTEEGGDEEGAPFEADWQCAGRISHTLTHFHLELDVKWAPTEGAPAPFFWTPIAEHGAFPTLFRKAAVAALSAAGEL